MGIPLRKGRFFNGDRIGGEPVIVIDDNLSTTCLWHTGAVSKRIWFPPWRRFWWWA
jgi:hypothetical protein